MMCDVDAVDDAIRRDFETMPYHLFQEKYRDILTKYLAHLSRVRNADGTRKYADNTVRAYISSIRSFFTNEAASVKLQNGKVPKVVRARDEHVFTHD